MKWNEINNLMKSIIELQLNTLLVEKYWLKMVIKHSVSSLWRCVWGSSKISAILWHRSLLPSKSSSWTRKVIRNWWGLKNTFFWIILLQKMQFELHFKVNIQIWTFWIIAPVILLLNFFLHYLSDSSLFIVN